MRRFALAALVLLSVAGCGGGHSASSGPPIEGPLQAGPDGVWIFRPAGKPRGLVVFFHGQGGATEATPVNHRPWIDHLVRRGDVVVYPRWEVVYEADPLEHAVEGVRKAVDQLGHVSGLPVLAIGYSRGGALALEYAAVASSKHVPVPDAVMSVFPAPQGDVDHTVDFSTLSPRMELLLMVGDRDTVVSTSGARFLLQRLQGAGFPGDQIRIDVVHSHGSFVADHFAVMRTTPAARAAFWSSADQVLTALQ